MNVLFIDTVHPILQERLSEASYTCVDATTWSQEAILQALPSQEGVVIRSKFTINQAFFERARQLKFIARSGSGLENIDLNAAQKAGVHVFNSPEGNRDAVAEHAVGMMLSLLNNFQHGNQEVREGVWKREANRGRELKHLTVGIFGFGFMGKAIAQRLAGFGCRIIAYDKYAPIDSNLVESVSLEGFLKHADIATFHIPQTEETTYLLNAGFLNAFDKPVYIINTSRGKILKTSALIASLEAGKVLGAGLDVLEYESTSFMEVTAFPDDFKRLAARNDVLLTPHVAGWTTESYYKLSDVLADKVLNHFNR